MGTGAAADRADVDLVSHLGGGGVEHQRPDARPEVEDD
jgi:hypothetical protein